MKKLILFSIIFILGFLTLGATWPTYSKLPTTSTTGTPNCRLINGTIGPCSSTSPYCGLPSIAGNYVPNCDIDGQPRYEPYPPIGCPPQLKADVGADQYYGPGCEPIVNVFGAPSYCPGIATAETIAWNNLLISTSWKLFAKQYSAEAASIKTWYADGAPGALLQTKTHFGASIVEMINLRYITGC